MDSDPRTHGDLSVSLPFGNADKSPCRENGIGDALAGLEDLDALPTAEHVSRFAAVHDAMAEALSETLPETLPETLQSIDEV